MTEELVVRLEDKLFESGFIMCEAAAAVGIHRNSLTNWFRRYPSLLKRLTNSYREREKERERIEDPESFAFHEELDRKIPFMIERGGYIPFLDHQAPPDISWDNYKYYREKLSAMIKR